MAQKIVVDPVSRIEGHLKIEVEVDGGKVINARSSGTMFRGIELILQGRAPEDAQQFVMRICGVCPVAHGTASTLALDDAFGISADIPPNGRIIRNLILGANFIQSHILHFYHLAALDFVDAARVPTTNVPPFVPRYAGEYKLPDDLNTAGVLQYVEALNMRRKAHELVAIWGGRAPHPQTIVPGGAAERADAQKVADTLYRLKELIEFIDKKYVPVVNEVAKYYPEYTTIGVGCKNMLSYGSFPQGANDPQGADGLFKQGILWANKNKQLLDPAQISEEVKYSWYNDDTGGSNHPSESVITPHVDKAGAYSFLKAPRYEGKPMEVGPLARQMVIGQKDVMALGDGAYSVIGRHLARAVETSAIAHEMEKWVLQLELGQPAYVSHVVPKESHGMGLCEAPRGALGHWIKIEDHKTDKYNAVVPTTWNCSPRTSDKRADFGPVEQALMDTVVADPNNPIELVRIVRAFDPCLACAIHLMTPDKKVLGEFRVY